jgi:2-polyprenyl-3-methyl-5-hydroxy-6-metoxy-1,4-benzoquinol methylase
MNELEHIHTLQLEASPQYSRTLHARMDSCPPEERELLEEIAGMIRKIAGEELPSYCEGYNWICDAFLREELEFRRSGEYRLKTFDEAFEQVYDRPEVMVPYMRGLLMTQLWWPNHTSALNYLRHSFLPSLPDQYSFLEIGPGHGLLLSFPANDPRCASIEAWDISDSSLMETRECLAKIGVPREVRLRKKDLYEASSGDHRFDAILFSEVLEHLEDPERALRALREALTPSGRLLIHVPMNSPAPDHLFNPGSDKELLDLVTTCGFEIESSAFYPQHGFSLEQAVAQKLTISALVVARRHEPGI